MKRTIRIACAAAVAGMIAASVHSQAAAEGVVQKVSSTADGYCHLKIPALRPSTLSTGAPELKSSQTGDLIDFYGPCNYDPKSKAEVAAQKQYRSRLFVKF